jgi:hypothetical protein
MPEPQILPSAYPMPDPALLSQTRKTERRRPPGKKNSDQPHIPRPRNVSSLFSSSSRFSSPASHLLPHLFQAFILFRSAFIEQKNGKEIASKQQNLSRIAALVWKSMSATDQDPWYKLAAEEKQAHYAANPGYTFQPTGRGEVKRKTRKPTTEPQVEEGSCKRIADLIISGVQGDDLVAAAKSEGVAPFARAERRRRNNTQSQPTPVDMTMANGSVGMTPSFIPPHGVLGEEAAESDVGVGHYPPASPDFDYPRAPSPKF